MWRITCFCRLSSFATITVLLYNLVSVPLEVIGIIKRKALIKELAASYHAECLTYCQELLELQKKVDEVSNFTLLVLVSHAVFCISCLLCSEFIRSASTFNVSMKCLLMCLTDRICLLRNFMVVVSDSKVVVEK